MPNGEIKSFRDLIVWQKVKEFTVAVYKITKDFPREEAYGLTSQIRRASVSIVSNIAERFHRKSSKEKIQFLRISYGSGAEIETQLEIAKDLSYITPTVYTDLVRQLSEIMKIINVVISKL